MESDAHFVKSEPHFSAMHLRRPASQMFALVMPDETFASFTFFSLCASSKARWRAMVAASSADDESDVAPPISVNTSLNIDVLLSTIITRSGSGSGVVMVVSDWVVVVATAVVDWVLFVVVGIRAPVDGVRFCIWFADVFANVGRAVVAVVAAFAIPDTAIIANMEQPQKIFVVVFILL